MMRVLLCLCFVILLVSAPVDAKKKKKKAVPMTAAERGLVSKEVQAQSVLAEHASYCERTKEKHFAGEVLAYVTPWNGKGYDIAKRHAEKFTYIAPVWFQLRPDPATQGKKLMVTGGHDVDVSWLQALRNNTKPPKIVPRFMVELPEAALLKIPTDKTLQQDIIDSITKEVTRSNLDGLVLEMTNVWALVQAKAPKNRPKLNKFVNELAKALHALEPRKELILVAPPVPDGGMFNHNDFLSLYASVDRLSFMTYDWYQYSRQAGPNAPLQWVDGAIFKMLGEEFAGAAEVSKKVLMGLNFYGMDFSNSGTAHVLGHDYVKLLETHNPTLQYDASSGEHRIEYSKPGKDGKPEPHHVFYPTLQSIHERIELAKRRKVGISIWEIGQGLDYFYDLL